MKAIEVISIPVTDQQRSKLFYMKLGFELLVEIGLDNGQTWIQLGLPGQITTIALIKRWPYTEVAMPAGTLQGLIMETDDIEKEVAELRLKGIYIGKQGPNGFEAGTIDNTDWGRFAYVYDPDGNGINIHQFCI